MKRGDGDENETVGRAALTLLGAASPAHSQTTGFIYNNGTYTTLSD